MCAIAKVVSCFTNDGYRGGNGFSKIKLEEKIKTMRENRDILCTLLSVAPFRICRCFARPVAQRTSGSSDPAWNGSTIKARRRIVSDDSSRKCPFISKKYQLLLCYISDENW